MKSVGHITTVDFTKLGWIILKQGNRSVTSRHMIVCRVAKKSNDHTVSILTGRKKTAFSCVHSSMAFSPNTLFLHYSCPPGRVRHTANLIKFATAICEIWVFKILF